MLRLTIALARFRARLDAGRAERLLSPPRVPLLFRPWREVYLSEWKAENHYWQERAFYQRCRFLVFSEDNEYVTAARHMTNDW